MRDVVLRDSKRKAIKSYCAGAWTPSCLNILWKWSIITLQICTHFSFRCTHNSLQLRNKRRITMKHFSFFILLLFNRFCCCCCSLLWMHHNLKYHHFSTIRPAIQSWACSTQCWCTTNGRWLAWQRYIRTIGGLLRNDPLPSRSIRFVCMTRFTINTQFHFKSIRNCAICLSSPDFRSNF